jgi:hypothetical protein
MQRDLMGKGIVLIGLVAGSMLLCSVEAFQPAPKLYRAPPEDVPPQVVVPAGGPEPECFQVCHDRCTGTRRIPGCGANFSCAPLPHAICSKPAAKLTGLSYVVPCKRTPSKFTDPSAALIITQSHLSCVGGDSGLSLRAEQSKRTG